MYHLDTFGKSYEAQRFLIEDLRPPLDQGGVHPVNHLDTFLSSILPWAGTQIESVSGISESNDICIVPTMRLFEFLYFLVGK